MLWEVGKCHIGITTHIMVYIICLVKRYTYEVIVILSFGHCAHLKSCFLQRKTKNTQVFSLCPGCVLTSSVIVYNLVHSKPCQFSKQIQYNGICNICFWVGVCFFNSYDVGYYIRNIQKLVYSIYVCCISMIIARPMVKMEDHACKNHKLHNYKFIKYKFYKIFIN